MVTPEQSALPPTAQHGMEPAASEAQANATATPPHPVKDPHAGEAHAIGALQTAGLLTPIVFMGHLLSKGVGALAGGAVGLADKQAGRNVKAAIVSVHEGLLATRVSDIGRLGSNIKEIRGDVARNGKLSEGFVEGLLSRGAPVQTTRTGSGLNSLIGKIEGGSGTLGKMGDKIGGALRNLPGKVRGASLFSTLAVVGAVASTSAMMLSNHRSSREDSEALRDFAADVYGVPPSAVTKDMLHGAGVHPMVAEATKIYDKNAHGRMLMNVFFAAGDAFMVNNMGTAFSWPLMAAEIGLPQLGQFFSQENPTLSIFEMLRKSDKGEFAIDPKQKEQAVAYLLSTVPAIAHNKGVNNSYVAPVAHELVSRGLNASQIIHTIASPEKFDQITKEVIEKIEKSASAPVEPAQEANQSVAAPKGAHTGMVTHRPPAANMPVMHAGAKPMAAVGSIAHGGTIHQAHGIAVNS